MSTLIENPSLHTLRGLASSHGPVQFRIPVHQRDYAWQADHVDDFIEDLLATAEARAEHFFGTIVVSGDAPGLDFPPPGLTVRYVHDGQQRLTTGFVCVAVIRDLLRTLSTKVEQHAAEARIFRRHAATLDELLSVPDAEEFDRSYPRVSANRVNQQFLTSVLLNVDEADDAAEAAWRSLSDSDLKERSRGLNDAYRRLRARLIRAVLTELGLPMPAVGQEPVLPDALSPADASIALTFLNRVAGSLLDRSQFVEVIVKKWENSFGIFEGLNNRGVELSQQDLVKNYLLARAYADGSGDAVDQALVALEERWQRNVVDRIGKEARFANFLRHYLMLFEANVTLARVVRILEKRVEGKTAEAALADIEAAARCYQQIVAPSRLGDASNPVRQKLDALKQMGARRCYPVPLAALLVTPRESLASVVPLLEALESLYFRRSLIMSDDNKRLEDIFQGIAARLFQCGAEGLEQATLEVRSEIPADKPFLVAFTMKERFKSHAAARYTMARIEDSMSRLKTVSEATLEHVLPKDDKKWSSGLSDQDNKNYASLLERPGNLTLLINADNAAASNEPFETKVEIYRREALGINATLTSQHRWDSDAIAERQEWLAELAVNVWPR